MLPFVLAGGLFFTEKNSKRGYGFQFSDELPDYCGYWCDFATGSLTSIVNTWQVSILHSALFFFMFVMLTEPLLLRRQQNLEVTMRMSLLFFTLHQC